MLPKGIEPLTSALPRMRSTTELRQQPACPAGAAPKADGVGLVKAGRGFRCGRMTAKEAREARLAAQLRANLKRRKLAPIAAGRPAADDIGCHDPAPEGG